MVEGMDHGAHGGDLVERVGAAFRRLPAHEREGYAAALELMAQLARDLPVAADATR